MRIATYNAASVRARLPLLLDWLAENDPDLLAIQETKVEDAKFPREPFEELGYDVRLNGQKAWNGVATLAKTPQREVARGFEDDLMPEDARLLVTEAAGITFVNTYVPNGTAVGTDKWAYKLRWLERFDRFLRERFEPAQPLVWLGDVNVAPTAQDVYESARHLGGVGHHPDEFSRLERIVSFGLTDLYRRLHPEGLAPTFWDFTVPRALDRGLGWRIDHVYATAPVVERLASVRVDTDARRQPKPSDHTFVVVEIAD